MGKSIEYAFIINEKKILVETRKSFDLVCKDEGGKLFGISFRKIGSYWLVWSNITEGKTWLSASFTENEEFADHYKKIEIRVYIRSES